MANSLSTAKNQWPLKLLILKQRPILLLASIILQIPPSNSQQKTEWKIFSRMGPIYKIGNQWTREIESPYWRYKKADRCCESVEVEIWNSMVIAWLVNSVKPLHIENLVVPSNGQRHVGCREGTYSDSEDSSQIFEIKTRLW